MKFPKDVAIGILQDEPLEGFKIVSDGEWEDGGKYQNRAVTFETNGKLYDVYDSRSGSHFTDWYYEHEDFGPEVECPEVRAVTKTIVTYEVIK